MGSCPVVFGVHALAKVHLAIGCSFVPRLVAINLRAGDALVLVLLMC